MVLDHNALNSRHYHAAACSSFAPQFLGCNAYDGIKQKTLDSKGIHNFLSTPNIQAQLLRFGMTGPRNMCIHIYVSKIPFTSGVV